MFSLQFLLSAVFLILALFLARVSPSFDHEFSITHNAQAACSLICCFIFSAVIITLITIQLITTSSSFQTWLALDCFHILFVLTCKVRVFVFSALHDTHHWIDHTNVVVDQVEWELKTRKMISIMHEADHVQKVSKHRLFSSLYVVVLPLRKKWDHKSEQRLRKNLCYLLGCCQCLHLILIIFLPQTGSHTVLKKTMKLSDMKLIQDGLFQLQKNQDNQMSGDNDIVQILFDSV